MSGDIRGEWARHQFDVVSPEDFNMDTELIEAST